MIKHTIRTRNGDKEVNLVPLSAIKANCKECMGFEEGSNGPDSCTSTKCALYPFRTGESHSGKKVSEENKAKSRERMKALHATGRL
jgi:hypothetical protein